jgi:16S rRNA G966 N2-methylase RsmD
MAQVNVTQEHNNPARDGVYVDPPFAFSAAASVTRDMEFDGTISGKRLSSTTLHRRRSERAECYCCDRIEQCLCTQRHYRQSDLAG